MVRGAEMDLFAIHDQYYRRVRKFILASVKNESVADDLIQETFIKIQENLNTVRDPEKISSWIFRIAYHLCQDHFRTQKKSSIHRVRDIVPPDSNIHNQAGEKGNSHSGQPSHQFVCFSFCENHGVCFLPVHPFWGLLARIEMVFDTQLPFLVSAGIVPCRQPARDLGHEKTRQRFNFWFAREGYKSPSNRWDL
jgi:RNA polymerase sigma factor (sigma-70 family)